MELYFHEPSLMPLFIQVCLLISILHLADWAIQENYLKQVPARLSQISGPERDLDLLRLMQKASESISDADMVDGMLRGSVLSPARFQNNTLKSQSTVQSSIGR